MSVVSVKNAKSKEVSVLYDENSFINWRIDP